MRTKKVFLNFISEMLPQLIIAAISFVRVRIFLAVIGSEILGVYQLFGQILAYLSLAELGLTDSAMYYLYKPLYEKNKERINSLLSGIRKSFNIVVLVMIAIGLLIAPNVHFFIAENNLSNSFIFFAFVLTLFVNVLGYFSTTYTVLFNADQNKYKYSFYTQGLLILRNLFDIGVILIFKNLYAVLITEVSFTILQNIVMRILFKKYYSCYNLKAKPTMEFWSKTKSLVPHKIGGLIAYNIDVIIVSKFLGLTQVVVYNAYYAITSVIANIINKFSGASLASVGNVLVSEPKRSYKIFLEYNDMLFFIATILCVPISVVISTFVKLWYGASYTLSDFTMYLFVFNLLYGIIRIILSVFSSAAALFKETLICTYLESIINLTVSLLLIKRLGIAGLLIGTAVSMVVSEFLIKPFILNKYIFKDRIFKYYKDCFVYFVIIVINCALMKYLVSFIKINNLLIWFVVGTLTFCLNFIVTYLVYKLLKKDAFLGRIKLIFKRGEAVES